MTEQQRSVGGVTVIETLPEGASASWQFVYAPGAGSNVHDPFGTYACRRLAGVGVATARFQFPYQEAGSRRPDRPPLLQATWLAVLDAVRQDGPRLVAAGRSMGGRIASVMASNGAPLDGLALFAYPLHQPGHPERARVEHLTAVQVPTLFCSGTRDAFGSPDELQNAAGLVGASTTHFMEGADHGFAVLKRSGRTREEVFAEAVDVLVAWSAERFHA